LVQVLWQNLTKHVHIPNTLTTQLV